MFNNFSNSPMILDSVMPSTYRNSSPVNNLSVYPLRIYWFNPATIGDTFQFQAPDGSDLFDGRCEAAGQSQYFDVAPGTEWKDWKLATLASGKLYLYFKT